MSWNNGYEKRKFELRQQKQAEEYRKLGMSDEQIETMYEFDLGQFNSNRKYNVHTQEFSSSDFEDGDNDDSESTLLQKFLDELSETINNSGEQSRYWWLENIEDDRLARRIKKLRFDEIELLTLLVFDACTQVEAARRMGISYRTFKYKLHHIKKFLKNF